MPHDKSRAITSFDFNDAKDRKHIEAWMETVRARALHHRELLTTEDLERVSDLLQMILDNDNYSIPRSQGERHQKDASYKQLICWYFLKLKHKENLNSQEATIKTAEKFCTSIKSVERYCTEYRKSLERLFETNDLKLSDNDPETNDFDRVSSGFEFHLETIEKFRS